jgi:hypothetical protein
MKSTSLCRLRWNCCNFYPLQREKKGLEKAKESWHAPFSPPHKKNTYRQKSHLFPLLVIRWCAQNDPNLTKTFQPCFAKPGSKCDAKRTHLLHKRLTQRRRLAVRERVPKLPIYLVLSVLSVGVGLLLCLLWQVGPDSSVFTAVYINQPAVEMGNTKTTCPTVLFDSLRCAPTYHPLWLWVVRLAGPASANW